jgi:hypothetical protein
VHYAELEPFSTGLIACFQGVYPEESILLARTSANHRFTSR